MKPTWIIDKTHAALTLSLVFLLIFTDHWGASFADGGFSLRTVIRAAAFAGYVLVCLWAPAIHAAVLLGFAAYALLHRRDIAEYVHQCRTIHRD